MKVVGINFAPEGSLTTEPAATVIVNVEVSPCLPVVDDLVGFSGIRGFCVPTRGPCGGPNRIPTISVYCLILALVVYTFYEQGTLNPALYEVTNRGWLWHSETFVYDARVSFESQFESWLVYF